MLAYSLGATLGVVALTTLIVGCGAANRSYLLTRKNNAELLIPPGAALPAQGPLEIRLPKARKKPFAKEGCEVNRPPMEVRWSGRTAYVRGKPDSEALGFGQGSVSEQPSVLDPRGRVSGRPVALDPVEYVSEFRAALIALEANGCLQPGEGQSLAARIAESFPLQPYFSYTLRFGAFDLNQFIDLTPDFRLRIIYPIYSEESRSEKGEVKAVETVYYKIVSDKQGDRVKIVEATDSTQKRGQTRPRQPAPAFPSSFAHVRLLLRRSRSSKEPVTVAIILSSPDTKTLDGVTKYIDAGSEPSCQGIASSETNCIMFPPLTGVTAEIRVKVNGRDVFVHMGGLVMDAMEDEPEGGALRPIRVKRLFHKRLAAINVDGNQKDILSLLLMPGDVVSYR
jgi:hypothetical protein